MLFAGGGGYFCILRPVFHWWQDVQRAFVNDCLKNIFEVVHLRSSNKYQSEVFHDADFSGGAIFSISSPLHNIVVDLL